MPYEYAYDYGYEGGAMAAGFLGTFFILYYLVMIGICAAAYIMQSLSLYSIAKRRGIHHPWLAWVPVGNMWLLGSISDQYQAIAKKHVRNRRKVLLGLEIGLFAGFFVLFLSGFALGMASEAGSAAAAAMLGSNIALIILLFFAIMIVALITAVFTYIALYDLFMSCDPNNAALYLILSILFSVAMPILLLICKNKDLGMPARRRPEAVPEAPVEETPVEETPTEETPVEEAPAQETPAEEAPVEETPTQEAPAQETQSE